MTLQQKACFSILKAVCFTLHSFLSTGAVAGTEITWVQMKQSTYRGFYMAHMAAGGRQNHQDMSSAPRQ